MDGFRDYYPRAALLVLAIITALLGACGSGGRDEIFGEGNIDTFDPVDPVDAPPPTVTSVAPLNDATGVPLNLSAISAEFNEAVTLDNGASFTLTCAAPCTNPAGTVSLDAASEVASFTLPSASLLEPMTIYTGTISGAVSIASGVAMEEPFVWTFTTTTSSSGDTTRPRVTVTQPVTTDPGPTPDVPSNTAVTAVFSEDMDPLSIDDSSFTLSCVDPCVPPAGGVGYSAGSRTAVFTPAAALDAGTTYTATITSAATDLAGNELAGNQAALPAASDYVWTFTTSVSTNPENVSVQSNQPVPDALEVCPTAAVNVTFDVPSGLRMDPLTITSTTFTVTGPAPDFTPVEATSVMLDVATGRLATFVPLNPLVEGDTYTASIQGGADGVKDLAVPANELAQDFIWSFTVGPATGECLLPVDLQSVAAFGTFGGSAGMTNQGILTIINGDIGTIATATSSITGFHDTNGDVYTEVIGSNAGTVNGLILTCTTSTTGPTSAVVNADSCTAAEQARLDAQTAYLELAGLPGGPDPGAGNLANLTLAPGTYTAAASSFLIEGGDLTLDAQGDANAVWVFQMASTLTVGGPGAAAPQSVILVNGAQSKNIFWQVGTAATINAGGGGTMEGTIITQDGVSISTAGNVDIVTINGRALSLGASVTMVNTVINIPAP